MSGHDVKALRASSSAQEHAAHNGEGLDVQGMRASLALHWVVKVPLLLVVPTAWALQARFLHRPGSVAPVVPIAAARGSVVESTAPGVEAPASARSLHGNGGGGM